MLKRRRRFEERIIHELLESTSYKVWCPLGCGSIQIHAMGDAQPLVVCQNCQGLFCYRHKVEWHFEHTCEEYDEFMRNPGFRSKAQLKIAELDGLEAQSRQLDRQIATSDEEWRLSLSKKEDEAILRQIEKERLRREQQEREAEQLRREAQAEAQRRADREAEERLGRTTAENNSVRCPGCKEGVQKYYGW